VLRPQMVWPVWPGCAILVALLLLVPRRTWPALLVAGLVGFGIYDVQAGLTLRSTALLLLADLVEVGIVTLGVSYSIGDPPRLNSIKSLAKYSVFAVVLAPLASAFIATSVFVADYQIRWRIGFFTEALALLTLTPAILGWVNARREWIPKSRSFYFEAATLIACLTVLGYVAFVAPVSISPPVLLYSLLPFLLWSALRFGMVGISTAMIVVASLSVWGAVHGRGPFTRLQPLNNVMSLQLFLFFATTTFMVLAVLVEEQEKTERAFRESEKRFRLVADTAPVLIWMSETDKLCTYFNKPWLDFTGRSLDSEFGHGWAEGVHPDDLRKCMETYTQAFDRREEFRMEYRLRRHDGKYRWVLDIGVPRFNQEAFFVGYIGVGVDVTDRRQALEELRKSEERFRLAAGAGRMFAYEWDAATDENVPSAESAKILGVDQSMLSTGQQILAMVHPEDRERLVAGVADLSPDKPYLAITYRMVRPDGAVIWVERHSRAHFDEHGKLLRINGMVADITQRKRTEEALRESEERLRLAVQAGRMYAFEWDLATDVIIRSSESTNILKWPSDPTHDIGRRFVAGVHPDDLEVYSATEAGLTPANPTYQLAFRVLSPDGAVTWLEESGRAIFDTQGKMMRVVGMVADVADRKRAEEVLSNISRRLIEAQEQERARIARELHDDIGQRLALLAVELEEIHQDPASLPEVRERMGELQKQAEDIATDIQALSHELHSAKLEYLGIVAAMRGFCQEFAKHTRVSIEFKGQDLPNPLPPDTSLCLFRVLQEALHNSVKHSGVKYVEVGLWETSDEVHLTVSDFGAGFDSETVKESRGLGLISMEERLKLLNGTFSIESQPKHGTTIHARVPISTGSDSMRAAG
jgi:PAS domain S-box-containing protein